MRRTLAFLLLTLSLIGIGAATAPAQDTMRPAAVVNDQVISMLDLSMRLRIATVSSGLEDTPENRQRLAGPVLRQLIDETLQLQEAKRLEIVVDENEIESAIGEIASNNKMTPPQFKDSLRRSGILISALEQQVRASLAWNKIATRRLRANVQISEDEVNDAVERVRRDLGSPQVRVAEIFLAVDNPRDEGEVRQTADRLIEQLRQGANFPSVAAQFSQSATASVGGDLGWMTPTQLPSELSSVIEGMAPGTLVGPVRALGGYYIVLLRDRRQPQASAAATLRLSQILFPADSEAKAREATAEIKSCAQAESLAGDIGAPGSGSLGEVSLNDLPATIRNAVANLPVGQPSQPISVNGAVSVLVVCHREGGEIGIDRDRVRESLMRDRLDMQARRYMRDLRRAANVDVRI